MNGREICLLSIIIPNHIGEDKRFHPEVSIACPPDYVRTVLTEKAIGELLKGAVENCPGHADDFERYLLATINGLEGKRYAIFFPPEIKKWHFGTEYLFYMRMPTEPDVEVKL